MLCIYNYVDTIYDVIIPYTHNTAHVMILLLEIIMIIHYTIRLTYNTFNNYLLCEGYALLKCFSLLIAIKMIIMFAALSSLWPTRAPVHTYMYCVIWNH